MLALSGEMMRKPEDDIFVSWCVVVRKLCARKKEKMVYGSCESARSVESHVVCFILGTQLLGEVTAAR